MRIFKSLFKKNKTNISHAVVHEKTYTEKELNESMQCLGLDFMLGHSFLNIKDMAEVLYTEEYSCVKAIINNRASILLISTVMYPENFNKDIEDNTNIIIEIARRINPDENVDVYAVGIGLINKNASEDEKGLYKIGEKYSVAVGNIYFIKAAKGYQFGFSIEQPVKLSSVSDEYYYMRHLKCKIGEIINCERLGSCSAEHTSDLIDRWEITVEVRDSINLIFKYTLYLNAYGNTPIKNSPDVPIFFDWISK